MSLTENFKVFAAVTGNMSGTTLYIDIQRIGGIFSSQHRDCQPGAKALLRFAKSDDKNEEICIRETPDEVVSQITKKQKELLGGNLLKAFIPVSFMNNELTAQLPIDSIKRIASAKCDAPSPSCIIYYNTIGINGMQLTIAGSAEDIEKTIYDKQKQQALLIKRMALSAVI
tara:strand:- start:339232 stop:339744 length:513 start_codon:yes stop_codon:yes gene_type:complete